MNDDNAAVPAEKTLTLEEREAQIIELEKEANELKSKLDEKSIELEKKEKALLEKEAENVLKGIGKDTQEEIEKMKQHIASLTAQKDHYRTKYTDAKKKLEAAERMLSERQSLENSPSNELTSPPPTNQTANQTNDSKWKEKIEFIAMHKELGREEIEVIETIAKGKGISYEDAFASDLAKITLESLRNKREKEMAIPSPSGRSHFEEKFDLSKMSEEEKKARHLEIVRESIRAGKNIIKDQSI